MAKSYTLVKLDDQFREHVRNVERNDKDVSKPDTIISLIILSSQEPIT